MWVVQPGVNGRFIFRPRLGIGWRPRAAGFCGCLATGDAEVAGCPPGVWASVPPTALSDGRLSRFGPHPLSPSLEAIRAPSFWKLPQNRFLGLRGVVPSVPVPLIRHTCPSPVPGAMPVFVETGGDLKPMQAFIINLDSAPDRWAFIQEAFARTRLPIRRVPAVDGAGLRLPMVSYSERRYRHRHGRRTNLREIGCYLSHVRALRAFLATPDLHGLICEDDVLPGADLEEVLGWALRFSRQWNVLRLTGLGEGKPLRAAKLSGSHSLCVSFGRLKGSGAYVVDRVAAQALATYLLPMWLPFDHALDREWVYGLRAAYVLPFPCSQTGQGFPSSIQNGNQGKQPPLGRWLRTYPYQAANEAARWLFRTLSYGRMRFSTTDDAVGAASTPEA